jgi:hypothetical protein
MEDIELKQIWASLNKNQEANLKINQQILENTTDLRVKSLLYSMRPTKLALIVLGVLWVIFLDIIINTFNAASPFFIASAIIQVLLTKLAIGIYLYQFITIQQVNSIDPIISTQEKLSSLKSSTLWVARILWLQLPVWSTFYLHKAMFNSENFLWLIFQIICTSALTYLAIWLFINIKPENKNKKWFRLLFEGKEWNPVIKSLELMDELREFKK